MSSARSASARTVSLPGLVQTSQYDKEDDQENGHEEVAGVCFAALRPSRRPVIVTGFPIFCLSLFGQQEFVFDSTAALENVWVITAFVPFAGYIRAAQLEFIWQGSFARPLYALSIVV